MDCIWNSYIRKEELEICPGTIDEDALRELTLNTYISYIEGMIEIGENEFPDVVAERFEDVMADIFISYIHIMEGRNAEPEEISAHLRIPENVEARQNLTYLCVNSNEENWPGIKRQLQEMLGSQSERVAQIKKREEEEREKREKPEWLKKMERDGFVEL